MNSNTEAAKAYEHLSSELSRTEAFNEVEAQTRVPQYYIYKIERDDEYARIFVHTLERNNPEIVVRLPLVDHNGKRGQYSNAGAFLGAFIDSGTVFVDSIRIGEGQSRIEVDGSGYFGES